MEILWILIAFICGLLAVQVSLPPLVGFLAAGFVLNLIGVEENDLLRQLADVGITLLLFTIGLKLRLADLVKTEVWAGGLVHISLWCVVVVSSLLLAGFLSAPLVGDLSPLGTSLVAFALGFSSTVCVVKLLEDSGELRTRHGKLALSILVVQDIVAVVFLAIAAGETPSVYAPLLILLIFTAPLLKSLLNRAGHDEMLPLAGFLLALGGYQLFELCGVKGDLGALVIGMMLSGHSKANELSKSLLSFKDIFLIAFFLSIGLAALPTLETFAIAVVILGLLVLKFMIFIGVFAILRLRARTIFLSALALTNYSEFGLIVAYISNQAGWLSSQWLMIIAVASAMSFVVTSTLYPRAHSLYQQHKEKLKEWETKRHLPEDIFDWPREVEILVIGLGRVGRGAFSALYERVGSRAWGMDAKAELVMRLQASGMHVFTGDGENADLWEAVDTEQIKLVLLALPSIKDAASILKQLRAAGFQGAIAGIARYEDDRQALLEAGVDHVFNFFTEAGVGFAEDSLALVKSQSRASGSMAR
ncbi:cation:proton antiporter [Allohahella sp. A8]|uniref:cation:proton antiporter domain-containing protein n=1 Tax=Allohahella sp. A8 TaxID=3141461 RepID=UPI003A80D750